MPRRPSNLPRAFVEENRRIRLAKAATEIVAEVGREALTVEKICRRARASRTTFYEVFEGVPGCLAYCFSRGFELAAAPLREAAELAGPLAVRVQAQVSGLYQALAAEPALCGMCLLHSFGTEEAAGRDQPAMVALAARGLAERGEARGEGWEPGVREDYVAGAILWHGAERLRRGEAAALASDRAAMTALALELLLGSEEGAAAASLDWAGE